MKEGDAFAVGAASRDIIDEFDAGAPAAVESSSQVVYGEADVMKTRATLADELAYGRVGALRFEQLHEGVTGAQPGDASTIGVVERFLGQSKQVAIEWKDTIECVDGDADVRDSSATGATGATGAARSGLLHARCSRGWGAQNL